MAPRPERNGAVEVDREAAPDPAEERAGHPPIRRKTPLEQRPRLLAPRLLARQPRLAVLVFHPLKEDLDNVADMDIRRGAGDGELLERDAHFRFEADIDERGIVLDRDHPALDDGAFETVGDAKRFIEQRGETLFRAE